jgi:hypothetical protein
MNSAERPNVYDPPLHCSKVRIRSSAYQKRRAYVCSVYTVPLLNCDCFECNRLEQARIVDDHIKLPELIHHFGDCLFDICWIAKFAPGGQGIHPEGR